MAPVFDWNDLRHFLAVARTGSNAAGKVLGVNQSTVQRRLARQCACGRPRLRSWSTPSPGHSNPTSELPRKRLISG
jgi:hypothetical protein